MRWGTIVLISIGGWLALSPVAAMVIGKGLARLSRHRDRIDGDYDRTPPAAPLPDMPPERQAS